MKKLSYKQAFFTYTALIKLCDTVTVYLAWKLCWFLRFDWEWFPVTKGTPEPDLYAKAGGPLALVFLVVFHVVGAYRSDRIQFGFRSLKKVSEASILASLVFVSICYFQGALFYSRIYIAIFGIVVLVCLFWERALLQLVWKLTQQFAVKQLNVLLVGEGSLLTLFQDRISEKNPYPVRWIGRLGPQDNGAPSEIPYLGRESRIFEVLNQRDVDEVILSYQSGDAPTYASLLEKLSHELVNIKVIPDYGRFNTFNYSAAHECGIPLLHFNQTPMGFTDRFAKRLLDMMGASLFMAVFSPLYLLIAILVKLSSKGPVFYSQERVGADGSVFRCYKFRSMVCEAEAKSGPVFAAKADDRTTPLGKWLRQMSLDELPQMYNVFLGNMSLVGPRPERPVFVEQFRTHIPKYMLRHKMKSGITGWAQINGLRGNTSLEKRIKYDLYYIGHWSHRFDIKIILLTPWILMRDFFRKYAY